MSDFYIIESKKQKGPFTIEELRNFEINKSTLVWNESYENWTEAGEIEMLASLLEKTPPPIPNDVNDQPTFNVNLGFQKKKAKQKRRKFIGLKHTIAKEIILNSKILLFAIAIGIISIPLFGWSYFKAHTLESKFEEVEKFKTSKLDYELKLKTEIENLVSKDNFFKFSDSSFIFREGFNLRFDNKTFKTEKIIFRTAQENAEKKWRQKDFSQFNYTAFLKANYNHSLLRKWSKKSESNSFKNQSKYDVVSNEIEAIAKQRFDYDLTRYIQSLDSNGFVLNHRKILEDLKKFNNQWFLDSLILTIFLFFFCITSRYIILIGYQVYKWILINSIKDK